VGYGALVVGLLDAVDAMVFYGLYRGAPPIRILQSIASGLLGRAAYQGGFATAALGAVLHLFIALGIVLTYYLVSRRWEFLVRAPLVAGMLYGVLVYFIMNRVVLPLSAVGLVPFALPTFLNGVIGHALLVGLPAALFVGATDPLHPDSPHFPAYSIL
jgi:uncharacterized membrane protein YagU involved in acid resistance